MKQNYNMYKNIMKLWTTKQLLILRYNRVIPNSYTEQFASPKYLPPRFLLREIIHNIITWNLPANILFDVYGAKATESILPIDDLR